MWPVACENGFRASSNIMCSAPFSVYTHPFFKTNNIYLTIIICSFRAAPCSICPWRVIVSRQRPRFNGWMCCVSPAVSRGWGDIARLVANSAFIHQHNRIYKYSELVLAHLELGSGRLAAHNSHARTRIRTTLATAGEKIYSKSRTEPNKRLSSFCIVSCAASRQKGCSTFYILPVKNFLAQNLKWWTWREWGKIATDQLSLGGLYLYGKPDRMPTICTNTKHN